MKYPPDLLDPCCSDCGGEIPMNTLTEKNIAWAMEHGVRCEGCDAKKRARQVTITRRRKCERSRPVKTAGADSALKRRSERSSDSEGSDGVNYAAIAPPISTVGYSSVSCLN